MTNVYATPEKGERRDRLFEIGLETLAKQGWAVGPMPGKGKKSLRCLRRGKEEKLVTIRTTQDQWYAFPRTQDNKGWLTLDDVDYVMVVSVDDKDRPKNALVHLFEQSDIAKRFARAFDIRNTAQRKIPIGRGWWVSLYHDDDGSPQYAGAGAGNDTKPIAIVPLKEGDIAPATVRVESETDEQPLSIAEAKRRLALAFGVDPSAIKITVEG